MNAHACECEKSEINSSLVQKIEDAKLNVILIQTCGNCGGGINFKRFIYSDDVAKLNFNNNVEKLLNKQKQEGIDGKD